MTPSTKPDETSFESFAKIRNLRFGHWCAYRDSGELVAPTGSERVEPKVMELLFLLAARPNQVRTKEDLMQQLWPGMILGEDTLARAVSKLRKALGDDAKSPIYIETLPKRGYRFIYETRSSNLNPNHAALESAHALLEAQIATSDVATVAIQSGHFTRSNFRRQLLRISLLAAVLILSIGLGSILSQRGANADGAEVAILIDRANDFYFQYTHSDNEAAIALFERAIAKHPENAAGFAGLANAIAQRVLRWPSEDIGKGKTFTQLGDAIKSGHMRAAGAQQELLRATKLAERAVQLAPQDAVALKALGFVKSVREDFAGALAAYAQAITLDADAWGPMINIADIHQISGRAKLALPFLESAFAAMTRVYAKESVRIRPWYAETAILIAERHLAEHRADKAEHWYRRALEIAPFHLKANTGLAALLRESGRAQEAADLCARLQRRIGDDLHCVTSL
jgi:transcriptional activator of cad operon